MSISKSRDPLSPLILIHESFDRSLAVSTIKPAATDKSDVLPLPLGPIQAESSYGDIVVETFDKMFFLLLSFL